MSGKYKEERWENSANLPEIDGTERLIPSRVARTYSGAKDTRVRLKRRHGVDDIMQCGGRSN